MIPTTLAGWYSSTELVLSSWDRRLNPVAIYYQLPHSPADLVFTLNYAPWCDSLT